MDQQNYNITWDKEEGKSTCVLTIDGQQFIGSAFCHKKDRDMKSERTGAKLATLRAEQKYAEHLRANAFNKLQILKKALSPLKQSTKVNKESYEFQKIAEILHKAEIEYISYTKLVSEYKRAIYTYINEKEIFYRRVRALREQRAL